MLGDLDHLHKHREACRSMLEPEEGSAFGTRTDPSVPGWTEVDSATIRAAAAVAVRWTGRRRPWGRGVLQIERAVGAEHVWLHAVTVTEDVLRSEAAMAEMITDGAACQLSLPELITLHQVLGDTITAIQADTPDADTHVVTGTARLQPALIRLARSLRPTSGGGR